MTAATEETKHGSKADLISSIISSDLFHLPLPATGTFAGGAVALVAFIIAIIRLSRGRGGLMLLFASLSMSVIAYWAGWVMILGAIAKEI